VVVGVSASSLLDSDVRRMMQRNRSGLNDDFSNVAVNYGDGLEMLALSAGVYCGTYVAEKWLREDVAPGRDGDRNGRYAINTLKDYCRPCAPYMTRDRESSSRSPFPRRITRRFRRAHRCCFCLLRRPVGADRQSLATIGLYGMAAGTAYARSYTDHHWFSDVVAGAAISVPVSRSLVRYYEDDQEEEKGLCVVPGINGVTLLGNSEADRSRYAARIIRDHRGREL